MSAGPGWVVLGAWKQWAGAFFTAVAVKNGVDIAKANEPIHMYIEGFKEIFSNPAVYMALATFFVILSQVKINVTNAYSGSLSWSNFFSRLTHAHPGRVVWLVFHLIIALTLQELGVFNVLLWVLGFYSNVARFAAVETRKPGTSACPAFRRQRARARPGQKSCRWATLDDQPLREINSLLQSAKQARDLI